MTEEQEYSEQEAQEEFEPPLKLDFELEQKTESDLRVVLEQIHKLQDAKLNQRLVELDFQTPLTFSQFSSDTMKETKLSMFRERESKGERMENDFVMLN